ncbi:MAG: GNAT family N-acetyltransferase [Candidatus Coproplasma sp.]
MNYITPWKENYAKDLACALNNLNVLNNLRDGLPFPYTEEDALQFIRDMLSCDTDSTFAYAIIYKGKCIGSIAAFRQSNIHFRTAEVGYYIAEEYWGRGITTAALNEFCEKIFETTDIIRLYAEPFIYNKGSCKVLEKAGFVREGVLKSNAVKCGVVLDMALYAKVKEE